MRNFHGLAPESSRTLSILASLALACGAAACGPSNGGGAPASYVIVFTLNETEDDDTLTELAFTVVPDFGNFRGTGSDVGCSKVDGSGDSATFSEDETGKLTVTIEAETDELVRGESLVRCDLVSTLQPTSDDFTIVTTRSEPSATDEVEVGVGSTDPAGGDSNAADDVAAMEDE